MDLDVMLTTKFLWIVKGGCELFYALDRENLSSLHTGSSSNHEVPDLIHRECVSYLPLCNLGP